MMEKYVISKLKNEFIFENKELFILSMWKLTLGYGSTYMPPISKRRKKKRHVPYLYPAQD
jgi:hypothetical protein